MMTKGMRLFRLLILAISIFITGCNHSSSTQPPPIKLVFQLHWIPDAHQLGFWTALDRGIYKQNGLDVVINPGGLDANPIKEVVSGAADIGQVGGIEQVCVAVSEGLPIKAVASIHRETPHALISLSSKAIRGPQDFPGKTIAVAYGDTAELLLKAYMVKAGIDQGSVKLVPFKFDLTPLVNGNVDAITGFSTAQPAMLEKLGLSPVILSYSTAGVSSYGYSLVVSDNTLQNKSSAIAKFLKASREGWEYSFSHPEESIALMKKRFGDAIDESIANRELNLIKGLMTTPTGQLASWKLEDNRVAGVIAFMRDQGQIKTPVNLVAVYVNNLTE